MPLLVNIRFQEWTHGLDPRESRISIFEHIHDIPYSLAIPMTDPKIAPEQILSLGKGYCSPKHHLLAAMYRKLGLDVIYATFPFVWNDPAIQYPPYLRTLAAGMPVAYHLACRVRINGRWVLVDATWDLPLVKAGFPVNEYWNGYADTKCAVNSLLSPLRTVYCRTVTNEPYRDSREAELNPLDGEQYLWDKEDHMQYYRRKTVKRTLDEIEWVARFYHEFGVWLESLRTR